MLDFQTLSANYGTHLIMRDEQTDGYDISALDPSSKYQFLSNSMQYITPLDPDQKIRV